MWCNLMGVYGLVVFILCLGLPPTAAAKLEFPCLLALTSLITATHLLFSGAVVSASSALFTSNNFFYIVWCCRSTKRSGSLHFYPMCERALSSVFTSLNASLIDYSTSRRQSHCCIRLLVYMRLSIRTAYLLQLSVYNAANLSSNLRVH